MIVLSAQHISKSFGDREILKDVSFHLQQGERVGLVGVNGSGKTTLFRILTGKTQASDGDVFINRDAVLGYMRQQQPQKGRTLYEEALSVFEPLLHIERELEDIAARLSAQGPSDILIKKQHQLLERYTREDGATYRSRTRSTLLGIGFTQEQLDQNTDLLSGGQLSKLALAKLLLGKANLLLLDEPTNHLDLLAIDWLERFLLEFRGSYIVISHDRYFLDRVTTATLEIKGAELRRFEGNYTAYVEKSGTSEELMWRHYRNRQKEIRRLEGIIAQQRRWNREKNIRTAESKQKQLDKIKEGLVKPQPPPGTIHFRFAPPVFGGNDVLTVEGLAMEFDRPLFEQVDMEIKKGERVFLMGENGCGKTTLLRLVMRQVKPARGSVEFGSGILPAYYDQAQQNLNPAHTALQEVWGMNSSLSQTEARKALAAFLFRGDDVHKPISVLSGGEKARIALLKLMFQRANFLLLDEPTNHLDIASREAFEEALDQYEGTLLIVSHDRYLINRMADRILHLTSQGVLAYEGGYDDYARCMQERPEALKEQAPKEADRPNNLYVLRKQRQKQEADIRALERTIEHREQALEQLTQKMDQAAADYSELLRCGEQMQEQRTELDSLYEQWEQMQQVLERCPLEQREENW
ncbi:MAG: ABC-F family ATP-binding cassette domain-containing protein [Christensenellales bacterium]|jgi:ATP-binding cassette subfamily F protein 3